MNIMNRVTLAYMQKNRRRTLVTILGVIISVAMITAVSTFLGTFQDWMRRDIIAEDGDWQVQYLGVRMADLPVIEADPNTAEAVVGRLVGLSPLAQEVPAAFPFYLEVRAWQTEAFALRSIDLIEGRLPENDREVILYADFEAMMGFPVAVGDTLTLTLGDLYDAEDGLPVTRALLGMEEDRFQPEETVTYTVVGRIDPGLQGSGTDAMTLYTRLDPAALAPDDRVTVTVRQRHYDAGIYEEAVALAGGIASEGIVFNDSLLRVDGIVNDSYFMETFLLLTAIVGTIIFVGSVLLIYNAFAISVAERSRQLGLLASVGATRGQKFRSVLFEGAVIAAVAIPVGILSGIAGIGITFHLVDPLLREFIQVSVPLQVYVSWEAVLGAVLLSLFTIFISLLIPALRASRISPIEAIRQTREVKLTARQVRTSRLSRRLFGLEGELALKTLKRSRGRYRITILSLVISILLFLTAAGFNQLLGDALVMTQGEVDFQVAGTLYAGFAEAGTLLDELAALDGVDEMASYLQFDAEAMLDAGQVDAAMLRYAEERGEGWTEDGCDFYLTLKALDDRTLDRYAEAAGVDPAVLRDPDHPRAILRNAADIRMADYHYARVRFLDMRPGDALELLLHDYDPETDETTLTGRFSVELAALADSWPMTESSQGEGLNRLTLFISRTVAERLLEDHPAFEEAGSGNLKFVIRTKTPEAVTEAAEELLGQSDFDWTVSDFSEGLRQTKQFATVISVFIYGFVVLITLISVAGAFNTISTSVAIRRREFAMLRSVGMEPRAFRRMIRYENLLYGLKSLLYGLPLGLVVMVLMHRALRRNFEMPLSFPWLPIVGVVLAVFLIVGLTMRYAAGKLGRETIVEVLRDETV